MSNKMMINLKKDVNLSERKKDDVLVYDNSDNSFYLIGVEQLYAEHNKKMNVMQDNYEKQVKELKDEVDSLKQQFVKFTKTIQELNAKQINMVENFIKEGEK